MSVEVSRLVRLVLSSEVNVGHAGTGEVDLSSQTGRRYCGKIADFAKGGVNGVGLA